MSLIAGMLILSRDYDGNVHFIPDSLITIVSDMNECYLEHEFRNGDAFVFAARCGLEHHIAFAQPELVSEASQKRLQRSKR